MIRDRITTSFVLALLVGALLGGCTPDTGSLGTPVAPATTAAPSIGPSPSDALPATPSPSIAPTPTPTAASSNTPTPSDTGSPAPTPVVTPTPVPTPAPTPPATIVVRDYFLLAGPNGSEGLVPVLREIPETKAVATAAMQLLLVGPNATERAARPPISTTIPTGTRLLGVAIRDGVATVNLSQAFETGGGSASALGRLAQVVYTLTQFSTVDAVRFQVEGEPITVFGAQGVVLDHPVGRADFLDQLPAIFIDRPAWGASLGNPGRVSGLANVFEATFQVQLLNANGAVIAEQTVMASCGTGCWGSFSTTLRYDVGRAQYGTLRVFNRSARDGTPENVTSYQVWLTPAS
jgi:spore germination protein GerM